MIRLGVIPTEPYWLDLPAGVRVKVKPLEMIVYQAAIAAARNDLLELARSEAGKTENAILREAQFKALFAQELGKYAITEWEGIGDEKGEVAGVTPENVVKLMRVPIMGTMFLEKYTMSASQVLAEGNA